MRIAGYKIIYWLIISIIISPLFAWLTLCSRRAYGKSYGKGGFSRRIVIKVIDQFFLGQLLRFCTPRWPYRRCHVSSFDSLLLFTAALACSLWLWQLRWYKHRHRHRHRLRVQYFTPSLSTLNHFSSFCRLSHAQPVVRQIRHIQKFMQFTPSSFTTYRCQLQHNSATPCCFNCISITKRDLHWLLHPMKLIKQLITTNVNPRSIHSDHQRNSPTTRG